MPGPGVEIKEIDVVEHFWNFDQTCKTIADMQLQLRGTGDNRAITVEWTHSFS